jgi:uncharacterized protein (TIGR03118 family)
VVVVAGGVAGGGGQRRVGVARVCGRTALALRCVRQAGQQCEDGRSRARDGLIDVYDASGTLKKRFATGDVLNAPWGIASAPSDFGPFSNKRIVGNFGDGTIHAASPRAGALVGTLTQKCGTPITIAGLGVSASATG